MKYFDIFRYGLMKYFKRGITIDILLTWRCMLNCDYCATKTCTGEVPEARGEANLKELKYFVQTFTFKVREIKITGGSPELHPDFVEFINWLLDKGFYVQIFTNLLFYKELSQIKQSRRVMFNATYHHHCNKKLWFDNYNKLKKHYRILVEEIDSGELSFSKVKPFQTLQFMIDSNKILRIDPKLDMYTTSDNLCRQTNKCRK